MGCLYTMYADDITQIKNLKVKVEMEIERITKFEKKYKIKKSEGKFKIIPITQHKKKSHC